MRCALRIHSHLHADCTQLTLSAGRKKSTHAYEGSLHLPTTAHPQCFISFCGKKIMSNTFWTAHVCHHHVGCLVTGPQPLPKWVPQSVWSRAPLSISSILSFP
jgi:hypothetical protein